LSEDILVPLDGSPLAELALHEALALAKLPESRVTLLLVISPIEDVISDGEVITIDQQWENRRIHELHYLENICARPDWKNVNTQVAVEMGNPAEAILDFARKHKVDRIVMSTHGRTGFNRGFTVALPIKCCELLTEPFFLSALDRQLGRSPKRTKNQQGNA